MYFTCTCVVYVCLFAGTFSTASITSFFAHSRVIQAHSHRGKKNIYSLRNWVTTANLMYQVNTPLPNHTRTHILASSYTPQRMF